MIGPSNEQLLTSFAQLESVVGAMFSVVNRCNYEARRLVKSVDGLEARVDALVATCKPDILEERRRQLAETEAEQARVRLAEMRLQQEMQQEMLAELAEMEREKDLERQRVAALPKTPRYDEGDSDEPVIVPDAAEGIRTATRGEVARLRRRLLKAGLDRVVEESESKRYRTFDLSDTTLNRYLQAREFDVAAAYEMISGAIDMRKLRGTGKILEDPNVQKIMRFELVTGKGYVPKFRSRLGHAIVLMDASRENSTNVDHRLLALNYTIERGIFESQRTTYILMTDCTNYSIFNRIPWKILTESLNMLQNYHPQRLYRAIFINPPHLMLVSLKMLMPFMSPLTRAKMVFVHTSTPEGKQTLKRYFDLDQLPQRLGGHLTDDNFNVTEYLEALPKKSNKRMGNVIPIE